MMKDPEMTDQEICEACVAMTGMTEEEFSRALLEPRRTQELSKLEIRDEIPEENNALGSRRSVQSDIPEVQPEKERCGPERISPLEEDAWDLVDELIPRSERWNGYDSKK
jgi:hypothetical protein